MHRTLGELTLGTPQGQEWWRHRPGAGVAKMGCQIEEEVVELFTQGVSGRELIPKHLLPPVRAISTQPTQVLNLTPPSGGITVL